MMFDSKRFSCFIIGEGNLSLQCAQFLLEKHHQLLGIISPDSSVTQWAKEQNLLYAQPDKNLIHFLSQQPFDYLFSIVNNTVLDEAILTLPQQFAINYHDSPLPKYAGLYASSWALLHQESHHAITWHIMRPGIDEGEILKQVPLEIVSGETALTLNVKSYEAAIASFAELVDELATHTITSTPQNLHDRSYFSRTKKPGMGVQFRWQRSADSLDALVRALNFGPFPNPLAVPKLRMAANTQKLAIISELKVLDRPSHYPPGTITAIHPESLQVSTTTDDVALQRVLTLQGQPLSISEWVAQCDLQVGDRLPDLEAELADRIDRLDSSLAKHESFWVKRLTDLQPLALPDRVLSNRFLPNSLPNQTLQASFPTYAVLATEVPAAIINTLQQTYPTWQLNYVLMAAFVVYLARTSNLYCFDIGLSHPALQAELAGVEPFFSTQVPYRVALDPAQTFEQVFEAVTQQIQQIKSRKTYTSDLVARYPKLVAKPELKAESLFAISIHQVEQLDDWAIAQSPAENLPTTDPTTFPTTYSTALGRELTLVIPADGQMCCWVYNPASLNADQMAELGNQFIAGLEALITDANQLLADVPLFTSKAQALTSRSLACRSLTATEQHRILVEWNATEVDYPRDLRLHDLFEAQVERTPDAIAVVFGNQSLTYAALNQLANQLAHYLQALGVKPELPVGICMERSLEMIIGLFAILKAGGAYVPLDPTYPADRLAHIRSDSQMSVVLTQANLLPLLPEQSGPVVCLDTEWDKIAAASTENPVSAATAEDLAYIIYTSGSTGKPKGVLIEHRGAVNTILDINSRFRVTAQDRVLTVCSLNFDLSVYDIFGLLSAGGTLVIPKPAVAPDPNDWIDLMVQQQVTLWNSAPPVMQMFAGYLVDHDRRLPASLRLVLLSGDWIPLSLPNLIRQLKAGEAAVEIISLGGATEASIWSILYPIETVDPAWKSIPYGKPMANQQFYILDEQLNPVPVGTVGELYIGGDGVARGYLKRPDLNAAKFIPDPFRPHPKARLYRTGDLGRYLPDGTIEFLGRIDHQVKIRGFRVELGEIEAVLVQYPGIREVAIVAREEEAGNKQLVAYLVFDREFFSREVFDRKSAKKRVEQVRNFLKAKLPDYMVPAGFVLLESLPLTPNGKLDRQALPAPIARAILHQDSETAFAAPQDEIERQLIEIWQEFLGVQPISVKDNFFELGGNSLIAVRLWAKVEKTFNLNLPLATLFQSPTIEQIADRLRHPQPVHQSDRAVQCPSLVVLQPDRSEGKIPPLFCIHVLGRGLEFYRPLMRHLKCQQAIYGLSTHIAGERFSSNQAEILATHYIEQLRILQPEGPYFLAGISFGGLVAYEMAQQLMDQGQKVALLALLDSRTSSAEQPISKAETLAKHWRRFSNLGLSYLLQKLKKRTLDQFQNLFDGLRKLLFQIGIRLLEAIGQPLPEGLQDFAHEQQNIHASEAYRTHPYPGHIILFKATEQFISTGCRLDPELGWRELATGGLEIHEVPGTHLGMLQEPFVQLLAEKMQDCIAQAVAQELHHEPL